MINIISYFYRRISKRSYGYQQNVVPVQKLLPPITKKSNFYRLALSYTTILGILFMVAAQSLYIVSMSIESHSTYTTISHIVREGMGSNQPANTAPTLELPDPIEVLVPENNTSEPVKSEPAIEMPEYGPFQLNFMTTNEGTEVSIARAR
jgi:hypothetical protein